MAVSPVPEYSLKYQIPYDLNSKDIEVQEQDSSTPVSQIPDIVKEKTTTISNKFVGTVGLEFKGPLEARLCFSLEQGITISSCNDPRFRGVFEKNSTLSVILTPEKAKALNIPLLKAKEVPPEKRQAAIDHYHNPNIHIIDLDAFELWGAGLKEAMQLDLRIEGHFLLNLGDGPTTGYLRFPHLLKEISTRFVHKSDQVKIGIVGPGLLEPNTSVCSCPQLVELLSLFHSNAEFLIWDNNKKLLSEVTQQVANSKLLYDPYMLNIYSRKEEENSRCGSKEYQTLFQEIKENLVKKAADPKHVKAMLEGKVKTEPFVLKADPKKIKLREFDVNSSKMEEEEKKTFDLIVATMSLYLDLVKEFEKNPRYNYFSILGKFLAALKENGSLYVDTPLIEDLFKKTYGLEGFNTGIQCLEHMLGNRLAFQEVPLSDFLPHFQGRLGTITNLSVGEAEVSKITNKSRHATTSSITIITRTSEKPELLTKDQIGVLAYSLVKVLKDAQPSNVNLPQSN